MLSMMTPNKQSGSLIRKKEFYAYCAGLFDGEGSVYISYVDGRKYDVRDWGKDRGKIGEYHRLTIKITNTNRECLEFIQKRLDGSLWTYQEKRGKNPKLQYTLVYYSDRAMKLLSKMLPYLIIKNKQAKIGIRFQLQMIKDRQIGGTGYKVSQEKIIWREQQRQLIKELNRAVAETNYQDSKLEK